MFSEQFQQLRDFPKAQWNYEPTQRWLTLSADIAKYKREPSLDAFPLARKWELASAIQKTIRRGDHCAIPRLVAMIASMRMEEITYFWKRLPVIACEDVGPADSVLATFVVSCSQIFTPAKSKTILLDLIEFISLALCSARRRDRTACHLACVKQLKAANVSVSTLSRTDALILECVAMREQDIANPASAWRAWQRKNGWRSGGLLGFLDVELPFQEVDMSIPVKAPIVLHQLPSSCYDMYTRIGIAVLRRLIAGFDGAPDIRRILDGKSVRSAQVAAGEALFFAEGGLLLGEVGYEELYGLLHRLFAVEFGLRDSEWSGLRSAMAEAVATGVVDKLRSEILDERYAQGSLFNR